jgi:maleamate amidohydrolase
MAERVWERFLTAQDKASLRSRPAQVWGYGERPALLLVDLYRWVFGDRRQPLLEAMREWPGSCGEPAWDALPHLQRLLAAARTAGIPVVHVTKLSDARSGITGWAEAPGQRASWSGARTGDRNAADSRWEIMPDVAPLPGEAVIEKSAPSAFFGSLLAAQLNALRVDSLIIGGESTSGCVRATCVEARSYRYNVTVVEECVFDRHQATHAINLFDLHHKYADVLGIDDVVAYLEGRRASAAVSS